MNDPHSYAYNRSDKKPNWRYWILFAAIIAFVLYNGVTIVWSEIAAPSQTKATPEFSDGFCAGWNAAQQMEATRAGNWRALIMLGREKEDPGSSINILINSVGAYVLIGPLSGTAALGDGRTVDCTPKEAAKDPPKPAAVPEPKKP